MSALVSLEFASVTCCSCGVTFGLPKEFETALRRSHKGFWCPNQHPLAFNDKSDVEIAQAQALDAKTRMVRAEQVAAEERLAREKAEKKLTSATKRAHAGVCTLGCNRTFSNLAKHAAMVHRGEKFVRPKAKR